MAKVILFGGGDGGGLIITADGVRPIPPFDPFVRAQIKAVSYLVAGADAPGGDAAELEGYAARIANITVQHVEAIVGSLDAEASLIVMSDDGDGFTCGTTGRPPIPLARPPKELPPLDSLLARGGIDSSMVEFLRKATAQGVSVPALLENPADVARELGMDLPPRVVRDLEVLAPSRVDELEDPVSREVVTFFQKVLDDGRHVDTWAIRPSAVSDALGIQLSDTAVNRIITVGSALGGRGGEAGIIWIVVGIIVVVAVVIDEEDAEIIDRSGNVKF
jgi:hypothetical protein